MWEATWTTPSTPDIRYGINISRPKAAVERYHAARQEHWTKKQLGWEQTFGWLPKGQKPATEQQPAWGEWPALLPWFHPWHLQRRKYLQPRGKGGGARGQVGLARHKVITFAVDSLSLLTVLGNFIMPVIDNMFSMLVCTRRPLQCAGSIRMHTSITFKQGTARKSKKVHLWGRQLCKLYIVLYTAS